MRNIKVKISDEAAELVEEYMEKHGIVNVGEATSDIICEWNATRRRPKPHPNSYWNSEACERGD